ncbi:MAG: porin family protein [Proteobacteria bacterium]|nr:porin family protein [Pseudomonadota bacterium]
MNHASRIFVAVLLVAGTALGIAAPVQAGGFYFSTELGMNFGSSMDMTGQSNDRASVCDGYINPMYATVTSTPGYEDYNCTGPDRGATGDWQNSFSSDEGVLLGTALGYHVGASPLRIELEYFYRDTDYDQTSDVGTASGESGDKLEQELVRTIDRIGDLTSHNLFANLYYDFSGNSRFTPYVGVGIGLGFTEVEYSSLWARNSDAARITTGEGLPNAAEIQANLASTSSTADAELEDTLFGYQLLFGVDYALTDTMALGVKGRWVDFESLNDGGVVWDPLRGHPPYLRTPAQAGQGGDREHVSGGIKLDDIEMFAVSVNLKYGF